MTESSTAGAQTFFLGDGMRVLAIHHGPAGRPRQEGVLICPPLLGEGLRAHWVLRQIALALAARGYDVVRFDFTGMGNSKGRIADCTLDTWVDDIGLALRALERITGQGTRPSIVAARYAFALVRRLDVAASSLVAWDPVASGTAWLADLRRVRAAMIEELGISDLQEFEYAGYDLGRRLHDELVADAVTNAPARAVVSDGGVRLPLVADRTTVLLGGGCDVPEGLIDPTWEVVRTGSPYSWIVPDLPQLIAHDIVAGVERLF